MANTSITVQHVFEHVMAEHWSQPRYQESGWAADVKSLYKRIKPEFGDRSIASVKASEVRRWHRWQLDEPTAANRALRVFSRIFTYAQEQEWIEHNPVSLVKQFPERKRKRYASPAELIQIGAALKENLKYRVRAPGAIFLLAMIYTGARPTSLIRARWDQLSLKGDHAVLSFFGKSSASSGEDEVLVFPKQILDLILSRPKRKDGKIFHPSSWRAVWSRIQKEVGVTDMWARDLRRTFATVGLSNGVPIGAIGETLNHKTTQTTKIYARMFDETRVATVKTIASELEDLIG